MMQKSNTISKNRQTVFSCVVLVLVACLCAIGVRETYRTISGSIHSPKPQVGHTATERSMPVRSMPTVMLRVQDSVTHIAGPVAADIGELCVFRLSDPLKRADWRVIRQSDIGPPPTCYIDSSGSSMAFASNTPAKYTIIAAIVEEMDQTVPKILMHVCEYGVSPNPDPPPTPGPGPQPQPEPQPEPTTLAGWVRQNLPDAGRPQSAVLASCYEAVADAIEHGTIRSQAAAFSSIRTNTQAKIKPGVFETFLENLAGQIQTKLDGITDVRPLGAIFREIVDGLHEEGKPREEPVMDVSNGFLCPEPTGQDLPNSNNHSEVTMKLLWKLRDWTPTQRSHRSIEPILVDGCVSNGCLPLDDYAESVHSELESAAVPFSTLWDSGDMPVVKYDETFKAWRQRQIDEIKAVTEERISCLLLPWQISRHLPANRKKSERLYFSQGGLGSCMGHSDAFAHHGTTLISIARGAPLIYCPINPVVTWSLTKGGSIRGGQSVSEMAKGANLLGHYPEWLVGSNNLAVPNYRPHIEAARQYQSGIMFLNFRGQELANEIILSCAAGLGVAIGNGTAVSGSTRDANGVKIPVLRGSWAHATSFMGYRVVNRVEYIGWVNSHGGRYPSSDEGEPADMCWIPRSLVEQFVATASGYGSPYVVFPESITVPDHSLSVATRIPFPEKWRYAAS